MKKQDRIAEQLRDAPKLMRQRDAIRQFQSEGIFRRMVAGKWLVPAVKEKKFVVFKRSDVEAAVNRVLNGEMPPQLSREKASV